MPTAKKTKSGSWRVTVYDYKDSAGKIHQKTFTAATRRDALRMAQEYKEGPRLSDLTVGEAVQKYINSKKAVLSPSTHKAYDSIYKTHFRESYFGSLKLTSLDNLSVQTFISDLDLSPKTVRNVSGLLSASVRLFMPSKVFSITLPQRKRPDLHTPTTREIEKLMEEIKEDRELYICVMLCAFGPMRRSEACAIQYSDIDYKTNSITVRRARVENSNKEWIYKDVPKTDSSYRTITYPEKTIRAIGHGFGYVIDKSTPTALTRRMTRALNRAGLPHFRMHDLRHYAASILHAIGIPDQYIMDRGGWRTDNVMKNVYRDALDDVSVKMNKKVVNYFGKL
jgi:integrase